MDLDGKGKLKFSPFEDPEVILSLTLDGIKGIFLKIIKFILIPYFWVILFSILFILTITKRSILKDMPIKSENRLLKAAIIFHVVDKQTFTLDQEILKVKKHLKCYEYKEALIEYETLKNLYFSIKESIRPDKSRKYAKKLVEIDNIFSNY